MAFNARFSLFLVLLVTFFQATGLRSQTTISGALSGVVTDASQAPVPGATVEIADFANGATQSTVTDRLGVYRFFFLPPGKYKVQISHAGFRDDRRTVDVSL